MITSSTTITVPNGVKGVLVSGCGGGGGAGTYGPGDSTRGGAGASVIDYFIPLTAAGTRISCVIGTGGQTVLKGYGGKGGDTKFGNMLTLGGGTGGRNGGTGTVRGVAEILPQLNRSWAYQSPFGDPGKQGFYYSSSNYENTIPPTGYGIGGMLGWSRTDTHYNGLPGVLILKWVK